jgi:hypothetical protein
MLSKSCVHSSCLHTTFFKRRIYVTIFMTDKAEMNCYAGLASKKISTSDLPKKTSMKTTETNLTDESSTNIFRNLFLLRLDLENHTDQRLAVYRNEVTEIIERIDNLLQLVIDDQL